MAVVIAGLDAVEVVVWVVLLVVVVTGVDAEAAVVDDDDVVSKFAKGKIVSSVI